MHMRVLKMTLDVGVQQLGPARLFATPRTAARQATLPFMISRSLLKLLSIESVMPSNHLVLCYPLLLLLSVFPASGSFQMSQLFASGDQSIGASASTSVLPMNIQDFLNISFRTDWFDLLAVQGTQESSLEPQFKNINSSVLSLLYGPSLTYVPDYWKNHSFDYMNLCQQTDVSIH